MITIRDKTGNGDTIKTISDLPIASLADIYMRNKNFSSNNMEDFLNIISYFKLDIDNINRVPYTPYWDFLDEVANNIDTGKWTMHPYMWKTYIMNASYTPMTEHAVQQRCDALRNRCIKTLEDSGLPVNGMKNRYLLLHWCKHQNAWQDILSVIKTMIELNQLFSKKGNTNA